MHPIQDPMLVQSLVLGAALFAIGLFGILLRRNLLIILMSLELLLTAVNITFVAFSTANGTIDGQLAVFFIVTVAAAEGAIGLGLIIAIFRNLQEAGTATLNTLRD